VLSVEQAQRTLSQEELNACRPIAGEGGRVLRAFCPFHGSDQQRSLRVSLESGRFTCFACGVWGYTEEQRDLWKAARRPTPPVVRARPQQPPPQPLRADLQGLLEQYQAALPGSLGERYLRWRGIPLELARQLGLGYAADGRWAHTAPDSGRPLRQWKYGRVVIPHTDPEGGLVNLYGRAVGADGVPKSLRHDHLAGPKGCFNAPTLRGDEGPLFVCEGPFDALSLLASGVGRAVAIFGVAGWRWEWATQVRHLVFAFDADLAGGSWRKLAWEAVLRGKTVSFVPPAALAGCKDVNEAWVKGVLRVGDACAGLLEGAG